MLVPIRTIDYICVPIRTITLEEIKALFEAQETLDVEGLHEAREYLEKQFKELDKKDQDGQVHITEFLESANMLDMMEEERRREKAHKRREFKKMKKIFQDADVDGDGMCVASSNLHLTPRSDSNFIVPMCTPGTLTKEEFEGIFQNSDTDISDDRVKEFFHNQFLELDHDGDGKVEIAEYLAASNLDDMMQEDKKKELAKRKKEFKKMRDTFLDADTGESIAGDVDRTALNRHLGELHIAKSVPSVQD